MGYPNTVVKKETRVVSAYAKVCGLRMWEFAGTEDISDKTALEFLITQSFDFARATPTKLRFESVPVWYDD